MLCLVACGKPQTSLTGQGLMCSYALDFGQVAVGAQVPGSISISNAMGPAVQILNVGAPSDGEFSVVLPAGTFIPSSGMLAVPVSFKPFTAGAKSATVDVQTDSEMCPTITLSLSGTGVSLTLTATPSDLDFGQVEVHTSAALSVTLTNGSVLDIIVTPSISGPQAALFSVNVNPSITVPPNQSVQLEVTYAPVVPSPGDSATLTLTLSEGGTIEITLHGIALESCLQITPNPMDFSIVQPGASETLGLSLSNVCGGVTITVSSASIVNPGTPSAFSIADGSWPGGTLMPGTALDVLVTFAPPVLGRYVGELDVASTDSDNIVPVLLEGFGGGAIINCTPPSLDFETVPVGVAVTLLVACRNTGTDVPDHPEAGLSIIGLPTGNPVFIAQVDPASPPQPVSAGESLQIDVTYTPVAATSDTGVLQIENSAGPAPTMVPLSGTGFDANPCFNLEPASLDFGTVGVGCSQKRDFVALNACAQDVTIQSVTYPSGYALSAPDTPEVIAPGATSGQFELSFEPSTTGTADRSVTLQTDLQTAPYVLPLHALAVDLGVLTDVFRGTSDQLPLSGQPDPSTLSIFLDGPPPDQTDGGVPGVLLPENSPNGTVIWTYQAATNSIAINPAQLTLTDSDVLYVTYTLVCP